MNPVQIKKHKQILFHKANFKNIQKSNKFKSSNENISPKTQNLSDHLNERDKSQKKLASDNMLKKIEDNYFIMKKPSLFKKVKRVSSSNRLNIIKYKDLIFKNNYSKQKEEKHNKYNKQITHKISKLINNNKTIKRNYSCNKINKLKLCKTFNNNSTKDINSIENEQDGYYNNYLNRDKKQSKEIRINNIKTNNGKIIEELKGKGKTENFVNTIKHKLLCCLYL